MQYTPGSELYNEREEWIMSDTADQGHSRLDRLEQRTYHMDGKVAAIESQLSAQGQALSRIEQHLMHKPPPQFGMWIGIAITLFIAFGSGLYTLTQYLSSQTTPLLDKLAVHEALLGDIKDFSRETYRDLGVQAERNRTDESEITKLWTHIHKLEALDDNFIDRVARGEVARKAIGDWVTKMDENGTHWGNQVGKDAAQAIGRIQGDSK